MSTNEVYKNTKNHFHNNNSCPTSFYTPYNINRPEVSYWDKYYQEEVF
jgi:hypothetical protein